MIQQARKRLLIAALSCVLSGAMAIPAEAGIVPWAWDTLFGPVGSIRARRMCSTGYGMRGTCNYGPACGPCGGGCSSGLCGYGGMAMGGCSSGMCSSGMCASGQCGVNFSPMATPSNLSPSPDSPPNTMPRGGVTPSSPPPTYREIPMGGSGSSNPGGTNVNPDLGRPRVAPEEFDSGIGGSPSDSVIGPEKKTPAGTRPNLKGIMDDETNFRPAPMKGIGGTVTWSSKPEVERLGGRTLGSRSVQVVRQAAYPNSKWEVAGDRHEVAKK